MANAGRVAIVPKGDYSSSTAYNRLDLVRYNEKAYVAKMANTGILPTNTEYWMLMTSDGITIDTALSDTSTNPVQNKVVKTALDNIQTTSRASLSTAGWYRVAEYERDIDYAYYDVAFKLVTVYSSTGSISGTFIASCQRKNVILKALETVTAGTHLITKLRITYDGTKHYLEVYYSTDTAKANSCTFAVLDAVTNTKDQNWKAIDFIPTSETVDGVTVATTYDIPANASPVTDLDLVQFKGTEAMTTSILEKALKLPIGIYNYNLGGSNYGGSDLPSSYYSYGMATVYKRTNNHISVVLWGSSVANHIAINYYQSGTWSGWNEHATTADLANKLDRNGGIVDTIMYIGTSGASTAETLCFQNNKRKILNQITAEGLHTVYDSTNSKRIYSSDLSGNNTWHGTAEGNLPLDGGTITGTGYTPLQIKDANYDVTLLGFLGKSGVLGNLGFDGANNPTFKDTSNNYHSLLHTGNSAKVVINETAPSDTNALWVY